MNTKPLLILALLFFTGSGVLRAQAAVPPPAAAPAVTWTVTPAFVSHYLFRGVRLGGASFQPTVELGYGQLVAGVWANLPMHDKVPGASDPEIDPYFGYTIPLGDGLNVVVGGTWYHFPRAEESAGFYENTFEPNVALNYTINGLRLTPKLYYDVVLEGVTAELTAMYALPLPRWGTELDFTGVIGGYKWDDAAENSTPATRNWGDYWSLGVSMPYQVAANQRITVGFAYVKGSNNYFKQGSAPRVENALAAGRGVASVAYSVSF